MNTSEKSSIRETIIETLETIKHKLPPEFKLIMRIEEATQVTKGNDLVTRETTRVDIFNGSNRVNSFVWDTAKADDSNINSLRYKIVTSLNQDIERENKSDTTTAKVGSFKTGCLGVPRPLGDLNHERY